MLNNDAWSAVAELAASQHGCFTQPQAAKHGLGRSRVNRAVDLGIVERVMPKVLRFGGSPPTWSGRLMAACLSSGSVASHRAAARLHQLDGFNSTILEVSTARGHMPVTEGVVVHRWSNPAPDLDHTVVAGIPCTNVAVTLAQLGAVVSQQVVEQALDDALRDGSSIEWIRQTVDRLHRPGPSGTGTLRDILADPARCGQLPDSWFERLTQQLLVSRGVATPVMQHEVVVGSGRRFRLDFAWPDIALGLECHSRRHHFGPGKATRDQQRELELAGIGWKLLYMTWHDCVHPEKFVPLLAQTIAARSAQLNGTIQSNDTMRIGRRA